jgi:hypothetical protein
MKIRYPIIGSSAILALAIAVPALASNHAAHGARVAATPAHVKRAPKHARKSSAENCSMPNSNPRTCALEASESPPETPGLTAADGARLAKTGSITLPVSVSDAGTISLNGEAPLGSETESATGTGPDGSSQQSQVPKNYQRIIEPVSVTVEHAGTVSLTLQLTASARAELAAGKKLQLGLSLSSSNSPVTLQMFVPLAAD